MRLFLFFMIISLAILSCQRDSDFEKFIVNKKLSSNDTVKLLSKYPELKLFTSEVPESLTRTAYITQTASFTDGPRRSTFFFDDYKCKVKYQQDTLNIWLNNNNGYFGNGVLVKVFNDQFYIKNIDPKTLKNEEKFIKAQVFSQKLILNNNKFNKNDSIYGYIDYMCTTDSLVDKRFKGYFKTIIK